jgi:hypothetical protein
MTLSLIIYAEHTNVVEVMPVKERKGEGDRKDG